jgi:cytochrome c peroxidase
VDPAQPDGPQESDEIRNVDTRGKIMRRPTLYVPLLVMSFAFLAFSQNLARIGEPFSKAEWAIIDTLSPLPSLPVDTTNKYRDSSDAALLGQKLFFEPRLSGPIQTGTPAEGQLGNIGDKYKIACRNCHMPESKWLFDNPVEQRRPHSKRHRPWFVVDDSQRQ